MTRRIFLRKISGLDASRVILLQAFSPVLARRASESTATTLAGASG
jgi:hypothetical protein